MIDDEVRTHTHSLNPNKPTEPLTTEMGKQTNEHEMGSHSHEQKMGNNTHEENPEEPLDTFGNHAYAHDPGEGDHANETEWLDKIMG